MAVRRCYCISIVAYTYNRTLYMYFTCLNFQYIFCKKIIFFLFSSMFLVTLDYKGLILLWEKVGDDDFMLGGQGLAVEFCIFCLAMRVGL